MLVVLPMHVYECYFIKSSIGLTTCYNIRNTLCNGTHILQYLITVRQPCMAFEPHEGTNENTRRRSAPGCSYHQRKHAVWRNILPLADRRLELCRTLFQQIMRDDTHVLHYLLPLKRDTQLTGRLRSSEHIQQFMQGLVIIKTLLSYMD